MTQINTTQLLGYRVQTSTPDPILFQANTPQSTKLAKDNTIMEIECRLTGNLVVGVAAATLKDGGILNLINRLSLVAPNQRNIMRYRGKFAQLLHHIYSRFAPYIAQPAVTVGTNPFEAYFSVPINAFTTDNTGIPDWRSLLDPTTLGVGNLVLETEWTNEGTVATAGGGGTVAISNVKLELKVYHNRTSQVGIPGGLGWTNAITGLPEYFGHTITGDTQPINQTQARLPLTLADRDVHQRLILATEQDGVLVDGILNAVEVGASETGYQTMDAARIQRQNADRYGFSSLKTGIYIIDFTRMGYMQQMLTYSGATELRVHLDVTKPGAGTIHNITYMQDRFVIPRKQ